MKDSYRRTIFKQALDYILGRSKLTPLWPKWSTRDIEDFWSLQWEQNNAQNDG